MKAIYDAARLLLYPMHRTNDAHVAFHHGINPYKPALRDALVAFEHANRGHRNLLASPALSLAHAGRQVGPYADKSYRSMRTTLRESTYALAQAIVQGQPHPVTPALTHLMKQSDPQGWLQHFAKGKIYELCLNQRKHGMSKDFHTIANVKTDGLQTTVELEIFSSLSSLKTDRVLGPYQADINTLDGICTVLLMVRKDLKALLPTVPSFPEFEELKSGLHQFAE